MDTQRTYIAIDLNNAEEKKCRYNLEKVEMQEEFK